jgi:TusE/DsrC/DsvC family sulfur relay protein
VDGANHTGADAAAVNRHPRLIAGREIDFDREGFFWEFEDWSPEAAEELAVESGLPELGEAHWKVLDFFRSFYEYNARAPLNRELKKGTGLSILELQGLFPQGIKQGARRLAGLPNPKTCN